MHTMLWLGVALLAYGFATLFQCRNLYAPTRCLRLLFLSLFVMALFAHGACLYHWIDVHGQQNLSAVNAFSLLCFVVNAVLLCMQWRSYLATLCCLSFPITMVSMLLVVLFPGHVWIQAGSSLSVLGHILLGVWVVALLTVAALMAMWVVCLDQRIRSHRLSRIDQRLPSLTCMQRHLMQMLLVAFLVLTVVVVQSAWVYPWAWHVLGREQIKAVVVVFVWLILAATLGAHRLVGWRGRRTIVATLASVVLLWSILMTT